MTWKEVKEYFKLDDIDWVFKEAVNDIYKMLKENNKNITPLMMEHELLVLGMEFLVNKEQ